MITVILINNSTPYTYENNGGLAQLGERLNGILTKVCYYHFVLFCSVLLSLCQTRSLLDL